MEATWIIAAAAAALLLLVVALLLGRGRTRVIDMAGAPAGDDPSPAADTAAPRDAAAAQGKSPGEVLELQGKNDAECGLADWLMQDVNRSLDVDLSDDRSVIGRVAEAALKASADLRATGRASIDLPYIAADPGGPKHYRREVTRAEVEPGMIEHGVLLVDELVEWRGGDQRTVALAEWLEGEADEEAGSGNLDTASTIRLADAAEQAVADIARDGRAVVDLPSLTQERGHAFHFRREIDRDTLDALAGNA